MSPRIRTTLSVALLALATVVPRAAALAQMDTREGIALQNQILELRRDVQMLRDQVARGGGYPYPGAAPPAAGGSFLGSGGRGAPVPASGGASEITAQLLERVSALEEQVRSLRGRLDEIGNQTQQQGQDFSKQLGDLNFRITNLEGGRGGLPPQAGPARSPPLAPPPSGLAPVPPASPGAPPGPPPPRRPELSIQEGNAALARRDYASAEAAAREVLATQRTSPRAYDAQFLLAESLAGKRDWSAAAVAFDDAYNRSRTGSHAQELTSGPRELAHHPGRQAGGLRGSRQDARRVPKSPPRSSRADRGCPPARGLRLIRGPGDSSPGPCGRGGVRGADVAARPIRIAAAPGACGIWWRRQPVPCAAWRPLGAIPRRIGPRPDRRAWIAAGIESGGGDHGGASTGARHSRSHSAADGAETRTRVGGAGARCTFRRAGDRMFGAGAPPSPARAPSRRSGGDGADAPSGRQRPLGSRRNGGGAGNDLGACAPPVADDFHPAGSAQLCSPREWDGSKTPRMPIRDGSAPACARRCRIGTESDRQSRPCLTPRARAARNALRASGAPVACWPSGGRFGPRASPCSSRVLFLRRPCRRCFRWSPAVVTLLRPPPLRDWRLVPGRRPWPARACCGQVGSGAEC